MSKLLMSDHLDNPHEAMRVYSKYVGFNDVSQNEVSKTYHAWGVKFNNSKSPAIASTQYEQFCQANIDWITSTDAGDDQLESTKYKLTGRSSGANAFKRVFSAMEKEGDLVDDFMSLGTEHDALINVSRCEKYVKWYNKTKAEQEKAEQVKQELRNRGIDPDSDESLSFIQGGKPEKKSGGEDNGGDINNTGSEDSFAGLTLDQVEMVSTAQQHLIDSIKAGVSDETISDMVDAFCHKLDRAAAYIAGQLAKSAIKSVS